MAAPAYAAGTIFLVLLALGCAEHHSADAIVPEVTMLQMETEQQDLPSMSEMGVLHEAQRLADLEADQDVASSNVAADLQQMKLFASQGKPVADITAKLEEDRAKEQLARQQVADTKAKLDNNEEMRSEHLSNLFNTDSPVSQQEQNKNLVHLSTYPSSTFHSSSSIPAVSTTSDDATPLPSPPPATGQQALRADPVSEDLNFRIARYKADGQKTGAISQEAAAKAAQLQGKVEFLKAKLKQRQGQLEAAESKAKAANSQHQIDVEQESTLEAKELHHKKLLEVDMSIRKEEQKARASQATYEASQKELETLNNFKKELEANQAQAQAHVQPAAQSSMPRPQDAYQAAQHQLKAAAAAAAQQRAQAAPATFGVNNEDMNQQQFVKATAAYNKNRGQLQKLLRQAHAAGVGGPDEAPSVEAFEALRQQHQRPAGIELAKAPWQQLQISEPGTRLTSAARIRVNQEDDAATKALQDELAPEIRRLHSLYSGAALQDAIQRLVSKTIKAKVSQQLDSSSMESSEDPYPGLGLEGSLQFS